MKINLGKKWDMPCDPVGKPESSVHYPNVYIDGGSELLDLPENGVAKIEFRLSEKRVSMRDGKQTVSVTLELLGMDKIRKTAEVKKDESTEDVLDKLVESVQEDKD